VRRLAIRFAFRGVFHDLAGFQLRSFERRSLDGRLAFSASTMAAGTFPFLEPSSIFRRQGRREGNYENCHPCPYIPAIHLFSLIQLTLYIVLVTSYRQNHCFCIFEIRSAMPSVFKISGEASSIASGSWQPLPSWAMVLASRVVCEPS
jgi:hypothetical protein